MRAADWHAAENGEATKRLTQQDHDATVAEPPPKPEKYEQFRALTAGIPFPDTVYCLESAWCQSLHFARLIAIFANPIS